MRAHPRMFKALVRSGLVEMSDLANKDLADRPV
jgi:hypothetical protein